MSTRVGVSTIYFVRHGECKANVEDMNLSPEIDVLTDKGQMQASLLGKKLQDVTFTHIYASSYSRALNTAKGIVKEINTDTPEIKVDERIREREMGEFENRPMKHMFDALFKAAKENGTQMLEFEIPGGEPVKDLESRLQSFLEEILKLIRESNEPETILVVSHGVVIMRMMLILRFWSKDPSKALAFNPFDVKTTTIPIKNTAYHLLSVEASPEKTVIDITKLHESRHLDVFKPQVPDAPSKEFLELFKTWGEVSAQQCTTV